MEEVLEALVVAGLAVGQDGTHHVQVAHVAVGPVGRFFLVNRLLSKSHSNHSLDVRHLLVVLLELLQEHLPPGLHQPEVRPQQPVHGLVGLGQQLHHALVPAAAEVVLEGLMKKERLDFRSKITEEKTTHSAVPHCLVAGRAVKKA